MSNPFIGVDPYLESQGLWPDFRARFITYLRDRLNDLLPESYEARIDGRASIVRLPLERIEPDWIVPRLTDVTPRKPEIVPLVNDEVVHRTFIKILHRPGRELVTVVELLSEEDKQEPARSVYIAKRDVFLQQSVHFVELDLLLTGKRMLSKESLPPGDFYSYVARAGRQIECAVYGWNVGHPIPSIPVPLAHPDPDVWIDLATVFETSYERGRYARSIDYAAPVA
jgi:hypothetical protein